MNTKIKIGLLAGVILLGLALIIAPKIQAAGDSWETAGPDQFLSNTSHGFPSVAFHPSENEAYVAIVENANSIQVKRFTGTVWENYGSAITSVELDEPRLAFNPGTEELYVAYTDYTLGKIVVMKYSGSGWSDVGPHGVTDNTGDNLSLVFNTANNNPYLGYRDHGLSKMVVMTYNGSAWENVGPYGITANDIFYPTMSLSPSNEPYVAYNDTGNGNKLKVQKYNGSAWETVGEASVSTGYVTYIDLAFEPTNGTPYVVFTEEDLSEALKVRKYEGGSWQDVGSPSGDDTSGEAGQLEFCPSTNELYVAYTTNDALNNIVARKFNGSSWELVGTKGFNPYQASKLDLAFNPTTNEPFLVFEDDDPNAGGLLYNLEIYKYNKAVSNRPVIPYKNKKSAKKNLTFTFKDLKITTKKGWVKVWINGKKQKVRSVKKSGNNLKVALRVKYGRWGRANYNLRMQFKKKVGNHKVTDNWHSLNALTIQ